MSIFDGRRLCVGVRGEEGIVLSRAIGALITVVAGRCRGLDMSMIYLSQIASKCGKEVALLIGRGRYYILRAFIVTM